jgi:hypothetical protein
MGSDPRRLDGLRADEQVAARLVERATGATARAHDIGRRQGAYDVHLTYPNGRTAALEVTTHAGAATRNGLVLLGRDRLSGTRSGPRPDDTAPPADPTLTALPAAVSDLLVEPHVARRAAKVAGAGRVDERHLFVGVAEGGLPQPLYERLSAPLGGLPADPPVVPEGLTHLWLSTEWRGSPLLGWDRVGGWVAHQV